MSVVIEMPLSHPPASYRLAVATRYWHCARIVLTNQIRPSEFMEPVGHLLSMATELGLKAYLAQAGVTDRELKQRKVGHDLGIVLRLCIERGLELADSEVQAVLVMRTAHLEHFHRYGPEGSAFNKFAIVLVREELALSAVAHLLDTIGGDPSLLRKQHQHPHDLDWPETLPALQPVTMAQLLEMSVAAEAHANKMAAIGLPHKDPEDRGSRSRKRA